MFGKKIIDFIAKDTGEQNESKKLILVLRILILSVTVYFAINEIAAIASMGTAAVAFFGVLFLMGIGLFTMSYHFHTSHVLWVFQHATLLWIWAVVHFLGWNIGAQQFLMLLLILSFFATYNHYGRKIFFAICFSVVRLVLYYVYRHQTPVWDMGNGAEQLLQVVNTITYFWCVSVLAFVFSRDSQQLEGKLVEYNNQLEKQANTDTLTQLYNRRWAGDRLSEMMKKPEKYGGFSVCICDIDFFKKVNDNYGHDFGDLVLKDLAAILREEMSKYGFAARWGGEEFLLVFTGCNGDEACVRLEKIRRRIKDMKVTQDDRTLSITMTFGLVEYDFFNGLEKTLKEADKKLYMGKEGGRDVIIY